MILEATHNTISFAGIDSNTIIENYSISSKNLQNYLLDSTYKVFEFNQIVMLKFLDMYVSIDENLLNAEKDQISILKNRLIN